jgi:hypothetical protein
MVFTKSRISLSLSGGKSSDSEMLGSPYEDAVFNHAWSQLRQT